MLKVSVDLLLADSNVAGYLDSRRDETMAQICYDAEVAVTKILTEYSHYSGLSLTGQDEYGNMHLCPHGVRKLGFYMTCLASVDLWPLRFYDDSSSVEETLETLAAVSKSKPPPKCSKTNCRACKVDMAKGLMRVVEKHKELKGVCLGCIKEGSYSRNAFRKSCSKHGLKMGD